MLVSAAGASAAGSIDVKVRIEGAKKTLVQERRVTLADAPIIKDGNPDHGCNGQTALGALQAGTQGDWDGSWSEGLGYFVSAIAGEKPTGSDFFQLWVDHKASSTGFCDTTLKAGQSVLVFRQSCTYNPDTQACPDTVTPLGLRLPKQLKKGKTGTLTVVEYSEKGKTKPVRGATVKVNDKTLKQTNKDGQLKIKGTKVGKAQFFAVKKGHARSETATLTIVK
ncbi:MAG: hypothetical protein QOG68_1699 [Solirubrobacteraceae bacterium]|nr:hypothetical protein [Solirubrobacteraceae bacterium]